MHPGGRTGKQSCPIIPQTSWSDACGLWIWALGQAPRIPCTRPHQTHDPPSSQSPATPQARAYSVYRSNTTHLFPPAVDNQALPQTGTNERTRSSPRAPRPRYHGVICCRAGTGRHRKLNLLSIIFEFPAREPVLIAVALFSTPRLPSGPLAWVAVSVCGIAWVGRRSIPAAFYLLRPAAALRWGVKWHSD